MSYSKPSIPKGTRDFGPSEMHRRNYIFDTIREVFRLYGFLPVETPAMENLSTLLGKYGEEGDKLLFRILNSGDFLKEISPETIHAKDALKITPLISEKGLRYDLTVPFARYVVQNREKIQFPFKRYQIQPVWRADRPQKGRYREFYQCDADVIGSQALFHEGELIKMIDDVFTKLGVSAKILINNRKILAGIASYIGEPDKLTDITTAIDKMDKIGQDKVNDELKERGLNATSVEKLQPVLFLEGESSQKLDSLKMILSDSETGRNGIAEMETLFSYLPMLEVNSEVVFDLTLARGLNYYTGAIIEVKAKDVSIGSICGGGRYDDLTGIFGLPGVSGVGISFGADRIYDVLEQTHSFPEFSGTATKVLITNFGPNEEKYCIPLLLALRSKGINSELYPEATKIKKQFAYADALKIPFVIIAGDEEINENVFTLKNMASGKQDKYTLAEILDIIQSNEV